MKTSVWLLFFSNAVDKVDIRRGSDGEGHSVVVVFAEEKYNSKEQKK